MSKQEVFRNQKPTIGVIEFEDVLDEAKPNSHIINLKELVCDGKEGGKRLCRLEECGITKNGGSL